MIKKLRILYLKDSTPGENQDDFMLERAYDVRTILDRQELEITLAAFKPHVLLYSPESTVSLQEVLDKLSAPGKKSLAVISIIGGDIKEALPFLESKSLQFGQKECQEVVEEGQKEIEEQFRSVYHNSLDGILLTQPDGTIFAANPAACEMLEMTEKEICRAGRAGIVDLEDPRLASAISQREELGKAYTEITFIKKSGVKFPVELSSSVFKDARGKTKTTIILRDITERKKVEEQLKISHENYKTIFYQSPVPYWIYEQDNLKIMDVNEVALRNYGYTREEFLSLSILDLRPAKDINALKKHLEDTAGVKGVVRHGKFTHLKKGGDAIKVEVFGYKFKYSSRDCNLVACIDVTEKEDALAGLEQQRARLAAAQEISRVGYWKFDISSGELFFSDMMYRIWGMERSTSNPTWSSMIESLHPDDRDKFIRAQEESNEKGENHHVEYRILWPDGKIIWLRERGRVLTWNDSKPQSVERTVQDVTEPKRYLEKLKTSESRYKGIVKSQTNYLIRTDMEGNYTYCNDKFYSEFGWLYGDNEILGQPSLSSIMEYHHPAVMDLVERCVLAPGTAFQIEIDKPKKKGGVRTTLWDFVCLTNAKGDPAEIQCVGIDISARVEAERQLKDSKLRYQLVTEATSDVIWDWDLSTGILFWGKTLKSLFGYDPQHFGTIDAWDRIVHSDDSPKVSGALNEAIEGTGKKWYAEYRVKKKNGEYAYVIEKGTILRDHNNKAYRLVGAIQDVTEKKKLQDLLEKANALSRIGSFELDLTNGGLYWSPMTREIHEVEQDFIPEADSALCFYKKGKSRNRIKRAMRRAIEENEPFDEELEIVTKRGQEIWVRVMAQPELENGKCIRIEGSFQDIDKIKRAELSVLRAAREKETLLESIGDAFYAVDKNWTVTYWNKHATTLLSCPKEAILNKNIWEVFPDAIGTPFQGNYEASMKDKTKRHFEAYFERTSSWYDVMVYPSNEGLSVFFKDVTQRKKAQSRLRELNKSLRAHTRELVAANKGLEQFSYIVSHNLRAPVANILGLSNLLQNADYPSGVREKLFAEVFSNVERLDAVIRDLNSILKAKVDIKARKEKIDFDELVKEIKFSIQQLINEEKAEIRCNFEKSPAVTTVKTYLHSIFYNLIVNSIKYRKPEISPVLEISAKTKGKFLIISFNDNGLGIDLETKGKQIFNLYKRFHHHVEGKGMGLFMVKTQVEMLGGKITVDSRVNQGTTFTIVLKRDSVQGNRS